ncbi:MAG: autotransporter-associated beta strand repeat-containing protein, partial [Akkermansiaceae bacterium]|nr:autotransporter-associated beta strand repeat-containing protein [Verrucomicrobiales bacterium]
MKYSILSPWAGRFRALAKSLPPGLALVSVLVWPAMPASAATRIWLGATALWSNPDNWSPNGVPQNGDFLTFPDDGNPFTVRSMNNDLVNLSLNNITFLGPGYTLDGNVLTLGQGITDNHSGALNRVRCGLQFTIGDGRFNSLGIGQLEVSGTTTLTGNQDLIVTPLVTNLTVSGVIQGNGGLVKRGDGALFLRGSAANTYTGPTRVQGGRLHLAKTSAVRAISADVTIDAAFIGNASLSDDLPGQYPPTVSMLITNGGDWFITNGATVTSLFLDGDVLGSGLLNLECDVVAQGGCQINCSLNVGNQTRTFTVNIANFFAQLGVSGNIVGPLGPNSSGIIKEGPGLLILKNQNTYQGPTLLKDGYLYVQHAGALGSTGAGGETRLQGGILYFDGGTFTCPEKIVAEDPFATILFGGNVTLTGPLTVISDCFLLGGSAGDRLEIGSAIDGPGGLVVRDGIVRMSGSAPNSFGGNVSVSPFHLPVTSVLELAKPDNVVAVPGSISLSGSGTNAGVLRSLQNGGVNEVVLSFGGSWEMNGHVASPSLLRFFGPGVFVNTGGGQIQFGPDALIMNSFGGGPPARIIGNVAFLAPTNELQLSGNSLTHIQGQVTGGATILQKAQSNAGAAGGTLILDGDNQFTGPIIVEAGRLQIGSATALGSTGAGTFVNANASLALDGGIAVGFEPLTLNSTNASALTSLGPITNIWRGNITLQRTASIAVPDSAGVLRFESFFGCCPSFITGPGGLTKSGPGTAVITGTVANNYTGQTTVNEGLLEASRTQGPALSSNVVVSGVNSILRTGRSPSAVQALPTAASMTVQDGALWAMNTANIETLSRLVGDGRLDIG